MQTYLKTRPVVVQLLLFMGMAFGLFLVFSLIGSLILTPLTGMTLADLGNSASWKKGDPNVLFMLRAMLALQFLGLFLIPSLLFGYFSDPAPARYLGLRQPVKEHFWILGIAALLVSIPFVEYTGLLNRRLPLGPELYKTVQAMEDDAARTIQLMLGTRTPGNLVLNLIFIAMFAAVGEELFFRGVLQRLLIRAFKSPWAGIVAAAFFFSFFHFQFLGFIPRFLLGILLGAIYWYSGSLWPAILAHFVYDGLFIVLAYNQPKLIENPDATLFPAAATLGPLAIGSVILTLLTLWLMKRTSTVSYEAEYADEHRPPSHNDQSL